MSMNQKYVSVFSNWDKETFRDIHHEDFMFIRETELLTLDEQVENIDRLIRENDFGKQFVKIANLIHQNDYVSEVRWQEGNEIITSVTLIKNGKAWRQIANRVVPEKAAQLSEQQLTKVTSAKMIKFNSKAEIKYKKSWFQAN